ncbi:MAG: cytochrome C biogenesis protein [Gammaproteobacteria bacterium]|nr:MAG: cytochrome C biogenesis protein [Gammaproteobacteria bacterium]
MHIQVIGILAILLYVSAAIVTGARLFATGEGVSDRRRLALLLGWAALLTHAATLYGTLPTPSGMNLGFFNAASLAAAVTVFLLLLAAPLTPVENLGLILYPAAALSIALMFAYPVREIPPGSMNWKIDLHIVLSFAAYSLLALAALQALVLSWQDHQLRKRRFNRLVHRLPPLQTMERLLFQLLGAGFFLLSVALITGFVFLEDIFAQHLVHKTVLSLVAWLLLGLLLWGRWRFGWRGRKAVRLTLAVFLLLMLAYFGSKFVLELILHRTGNWT